MIMFRPYNPETDHEAVPRIWREVGWVWTDEQAGEVVPFLAESRSLVAALDGAPEGLVTALDGTLRYLHEDLPLSVVGVVLISRLIRKQGIASRLTARLVAEEAARGALVSALGMFEQGFYNQLGYGTGGYEHMVSFDPAHLRVSRRARVPRRLSLDDWAQVHQAMLNRRRGHGSCNVLPASSTRAEMRWTENGFGLGYFDGPDGTLTHFFWSSASGEYGPYEIKAMAYQTGSQLLELLALIRSLGDQVRLVRMREPRGIQLQDLLRQPIKYMQVTKQSEFQSVNEALAYWQVRLCDLEGALARTHLRGPDVRFNLQLTDPIEAHLPADAPWPGLGGTYVVTLGPSSGAESGADAALPVLKASVNAFTRLWLGIRPATGLALTDRLDGPDELLAELDEALCLPEARTDWDF